MDMKTTQIRRVLADIAQDMKNDATRFDGQPFNGRTVAEYFGNQGAAIAALARVVDALYARDVVEATNTAPVANEKANP